MVCARMLVLVVPLGCYGPPPPEVRLSDHLVEQLCQAPNVVIGTNVAVKSVELPRQGRSPQVWSHIEFRVDERLRGSESPDLHLATSGPEQELARVNTNPGGPLQPAVGLRYILAYRESRFSTSLLEPGDPGVSGWRPVVGSPLEQKALIEAVRQAVEDCPNTR